MRTLRMGQAAYACRTCAPRPLCQASMGRVTPGHTGSRQITPGHAGSRRTSEAAAKTEVDSERQLVLKRVHAIGFVLIKPTLLTKLA